MSHFFSMSPVSSAVFLLRAFWFFLFLHSTSLLWLSFFNIPSVWRSIPPSYSVHPAAFLVSLWVCWFSSLPSVPLSFLFFFLFLYFLFNLSPHLDYLLVHFLTISCPYSFSFLNSPLVSSHSIIRCTKFPSSFPQIIHFLSSSIKQYLFSCSIFSLLILALHPMQKCRCSTNVNEKTKLGAILASNLRAMF